MAAPEIILHHYPTSPFSEKVRLMLGLKGLAWRSVTTPNMMPKPALTPLTGGYRRAPVMQIGADVYCDSQAILGELERRAPGPRTVGGGLDWAVNLWADRLFFQASVPIIFGELGDKVAKDFIADREKLSGRPFDVVAMKAASGPMKQQWRAQAAWIDAALADTEWLDGASPGLSDVSAYMNVWFLSGATPAIAEELMAGLDRLKDWAYRVRTLGHGMWSDIGETEALEIARTTDPAPTPDHDAADPLGLSPGDAVVVMADDYGRDPVSGTLAAANAERVVVARDTDDLGLIHIHFPRVGYIAAPAKP